MDTKTSAYFGSDRDRCHVFQLNFTLQIAVGFSSVDVSIFKEGRLSRPAIPQPCPHMAGLGKLPSGRRRYERQLLHTFYQFDMSSSVSSCGQTVCHNYAISTKDPFS